MIVVYARLRQRRRPRRRHGTGPAIKAFVVERTLPGFSPEPKLDKLGMRGSDTSGLVFNDCRVPRDASCPATASEILMSGLDTERIVLAGGALGIMRACHDVAIPYVHQRKQFDRPIGSFELMQGKLADMYSAMNAARAYVYAVAAACDRGHKTRYDAAAAILKSSEAATWVADRRSRRSAATATRPSIPRAGSGATPSSTRSAPARTRFAAC